MPPWKVRTDRPPTWWERYVWITRRDFYTSELVAKRTREREELDARING